MRVYYQKEHQRITNNTDSGQWLIVTDATGDRWVKCEELRFGEGQVFCDMITERIEKYEKRMSYDKGKLNN